ncbi:prolyl-tRNA editing enzyme YbaK/EbsC (Cys-tRNA(Pro) deacylase) [Arthrobacter sp. PL16]|uniref:Uncharacterized protein n=1 Tax=Arthrobacter cheniae TaxID=1258888 RepID=A0A3A5M5U8_9MICC|nr:MULTISPECIES: hypothetical protein [Arthrobacter]MEC5197828.1 prolyl-tRNA editing enzyme YbaK/EbsC (Cys-tRNA(Pro) deacylase) [Arthrobacter sp. PL16]RJT78452.1 hypothetical protein D6T63_13175 [Arthrobacter cheniae]
MTNDYLQKIRVAAADKEDIEFELDRAELMLQEAVTEALSHGEDIAAVAEVAELPPEDVAKLLVQKAEPGPVLPS